MSDVLVGLEALTNYVVNPEFWPVLKKCYPKFWVSEKSP
jgi:hypothetical protein